MGMEEGEGVQVRHRPEPSGIGAKAKGELRFRAGRRVSDGQF